MSQTKENNPREWPVAVKNVRCRLEESLLSLVRGNDYEVRTPLFELRPRPHARSRCFDFRVENRNVGAELRYSTPHTQRYAGHADKRYLRTAFSDFARHVSKQVFVPTQRCHRFKQLADAARLAQGSIKPLTDIEENDHVPGAPLPAQSGLEPQPSDH